MPIRTVIAGLPANEYHRRQREKHREHLRAYSRKWARKFRASNPERATEAQRRFASTPKGVISVYRNNAITRGLSFDLDIDLVADLITDNCFYCGAAPAPRNGIDRVDNSRGYYFGNVVSCCSECNRVKKNHSAAEMLAWAKRVSDRFPVAVL